MAATISANSAGGGGLVTSGDASGVLALQTAGVTALSIDAAQVVSFTNPVALTSPALTGTPTAPTAASGTNTTQVATTAFALGASIGTGQVWSTPTRSSGVTYTNSTGKPIMVCISINYSATSSQSSTITVGGVTIQSSGGNNVAGAYSRPVHTFIVPNSSTYVASIGGTLTNWAELS